jgi:hypothetical protein
MAVEKPGVGEGTKVSGPTMAVVKPGVGMGVGVCAAARPATARRRALLLVLVNMLTVVGEGEVFWIVLF